MISFACLICLCICGVAGAADYQFGVELPKPADDPTISSKTTAFLWVPPQAQRIRVVILAPANVIERRFCDDPILRAEATRDSMAVIFFQAGWGKKPTPESREKLVHAMLNALAEKSGYEELETVPWIPVGHSGNAAFCGDLARADPDRTLANIIIKGGQPVPEKDGSTRGIDGVPILFFNGEFEEVMPPGKVRNAWWGEAMKRFDKTKAAVPEALVSGMMDRSYGHLTWYPEMANYAALFIHKAVAARWNGDQPLKTVAYGGGWLGDPAGKAPIAPVAEYTGDPKAAFWFFDQEQAEAWKRSFFRDVGKREQILAFVGEDGKIAPWWNGWALQSLPFSPLADGVTFKMHAVFRDEIPQPFADAGIKLGHGDDSKIHYDVLGWASNTRQIGPDTFKVHFDREGINGRTVHVLIGAVHPGDETYRATCAVVSFDIPANSKGTRQQLDFEQPADVPAGTMDLPLKVKMNSPLLPDYFVSWGPAEVSDEGIVHFTPIPIRAKFPIQVKVAAYQWGKSTEPQYASVDPVYRVFNILAAK